MPAPFGFGVGDFIAVATLIKNIRAALKDSGGARDEYQELERELALLELALGAIKTLTGPPHRQGEITAIKLVALSCRRTLDHFYSSVTKYDKSLSAVSIPSRARASVKMVQWNLLMQADVTKLRSYLEAHVGSLNVLISTELLKSNSDNALSATEQHRKLKETIEERWENARKMIAEAARSADEHHFLTQQKLDVSQIAMANIKAVATESEFKIQGTHSIVEQIKEQTNKQLLPGVEEILATTNQASQDETMRILEARLLPPDPRFTWAQAPVWLEDALGRSILIPSEYSYDMLEAVIIAKFKKGPGQAKVHSGDFELFNSRDSSDIIDPSRFTSTGLLPGMRITMAITIGQYATVRSRCANPSCKSLRFKEAEQGGKTCLRCNTWFDRSQKQLCRPFRPPDDGSGDMKKERPSESSKLYRASSIKLSSDRKSYRNIRLYTTELPSTKALQRNRFGGSLRKQGLTIYTAGATKNRTFTDVPGSWLQGDEQDSRVRHTTHHFVEAAANNQLPHSAVKRSHYLGTTAKISDPRSMVRRAQKFSNDYLVSPAPDESKLHDFATTAQSIQTLQGEVPDVERVKTLDAGDLTMEDWEIVARDHRIEELGSLGEGAGGIVTKCMLKGQKTLFATKRLRGSLQPESRREVLRELRYNTECDSEWICKYYGAYLEQSSGDILIAMEYCEGSCLEKIYREVEAGGGRIGEKVLWKVAESVLQGLTYLHGRRIIHRDIKPGNILFCKNGQVKIADFGVAGEFGTKGTALTFIGTSFYMAPERLTGQYYTINSDVWSLGVSLLEVAQHRHPYICAEPSTIRSDLIERLRLIVNGPVPKLLDEPELGILWSEAFKSFIECCLEKQPYRRATPWQMLEHPWMKDMKRKKVNIEKFLKVVWEWD